MLNAQLDGRRSQFLSRWLAPSLLALVFAATGAAYWPGLSGDFMFDDFANLSALGRYGAVRDWDGLLRYLTSGTADPTGRPVSMLSFLIDARNWPADPWPFKRTNLLLHIINGGLLYTVLDAAGRRLMPSSSAARQAALLGTALWLLHPFWTSTVLYVVQRHAMLAAFFVLVGIRVWIASRDAFGRNDVTRGWLLAVLSVPVCGLLAGLSKSNGFLLPLLLLALHTTVLRPPVVSSRPPTAAWHAKICTGLLVVLPSVLLLAALIWWGIDAAERTQMTRPWTLGQRLLTQPRAFFDYLFQLLAPGLRARGLFADDFVVSKGWLAPWTTLPALIGLVGLALGAWWQRLRHPAFSATVLFFIAGHLMESSVVPLELYFEHRNYLPATLVFWPIAIGVVQSGRYRRWWGSGALAVLTACALLTSMQARLWADKSALVRAWAEASPRSARAQTVAALDELQSGQVDAAIRRLTPLAAADPSEVQYVLTLLTAYCSKGTIPPAKITAARDAIAATGIGVDMPYQWLANVLSIDGHSPCHRLPAQHRTALLRAATTRAGTGTLESRSRLARLQALDAMQRDNCPKALLYYDRRIKLQPRPEFAHEQVGLLATHCGPSYGLRHLDAYLMRSNPPARSAPTPMLQLRDYLMERQMYWPREWQRLRETLEADIRGK